MTATETEERIIPYVVAFNETLDQLLASDPTVFAAGEDIGRYGGVFQTHAGLNKKYGDERLVDTPIAEQAIIGLGIGAAVTGLRPVVDLMFMDFIMVAMDQIANQASKMKYMFGGKAEIPMTVTTWAGAGLSAAAQHSASLEAWLCHVPGLKVAMPSNAHDVKGLFTSCVRDNNPTFLVMNKAMLGSKGPCPEELFEIPFGVGKIVREGTDATVVGIQRMVPEALKAAEVLAEEGINIEVIDPRTVLPFDYELVIDSAKKTNRVLVAHEAVRNMGLGAEISSRIQEEAFDYLDAPVSRIGAPFSPIPFSPILEQAYMPDAAKIAQGVRELLNRSAPGA